MTVVLASATGFLVSQAIGQEVTAGSTPVSVISSRLGMVDDWASSRQARVSLAFVDRSTGERTGLRADEPVLTASVAKLFIASQLAYLDAIGERVATIDDEALLGAMLSASDDGAASVLWDALGGPDLVGAVAERYGLNSTEPPVDGLWWHTRTTTSDIAQFYSQLLDERSDSGLSVLPGIRSDPNWADRILGHLGGWTERGADGYDQRFGLSSVFAADEIGAMNQGWMCCVDAQWVHLTTGTLRPDGRYILVVQVAEDVQYPGGTVELPKTSLGIDVDDESARHARETVTGIVAALTIEKTPAYS